MPRIIAGEARGIKLDSSKEDLMRPTADRVKEAIFSSLQAQIKQGQIKSFLDLFAGSGQIGLEAKSRGVARVVMVENNRRQLATIKRNIAKSKLKVELLSRPAEFALKSLLAGEELFDIIYLDPPWPSWPDFWAGQSKQIKGLLSPGGQVLLECSKKQELAISSKIWEIVRQKDYGLTRCLKLMPRRQEGLSEENNSHEDLAL